MPLKLIDARAENVKVFDSIEFSKDTDPPYYSLKDASGKTIIIDYLPVLNDDWNFNDFEVHLLENPYQNSQSDIFCVHHEEFEERLGWIFPITVLESTENGDSVNRNFDKYRFVAFRNLLSIDQTIQEKVNQSSYKLSDFFDESLIICVLHKTTIHKIKNFNLRSYVLSLYRDGYSFFEGELKARKIPQKDFYFNELKKNTTKVTLRNSGFDISCNVFFEYLFKDILIRSENHFVRFIFIYQIIEFFIGQEFDLLFDEQLADYKAKNISKNDFRENINNTFKERAVINSIFQKIIIEEELKNRFITDFIALFDGIGYKYNQTFADKLYDFRNMITHNVRIVATRSDLSKIIEMYEQIVISLLLNYASPDTITEDSQDD